MRKLSAQPRKMDSTKGQFLEVTNDLYTTTDPD